MEKNKFIIFYYSIIPLLLLGCNMQINKNALKEDTGYSIRDSVNQYGNKIIIYGNDSIYAYSQDGNLSYIKYLDSLSAVRQIIFNENGHISYIEYNPSYSKDFLLSENYYPDSNNLQFALWVRDTIIITEDNPIQCNRYYTEYYENGKAREAGYQGSFSGQGIPVGMQQYYNDLGQLVQTQNFIYPKQKEEIATSDIFTYIIVSEYYDNGKPKWEKVYSNNIFHESGPEDKRPIGTWKYYNENGKLIKTEKY